MGKKKQRMAEAIRKVKPLKPLAMPMDKFAKFGGKIAYIRQMNLEEARERFPNMEGLPEGIDLFALYGADGTPIVLTDSRGAAVGHAMSDELELTCLQ